MNIFLAVSAALAWIFGSALLLATAQFLGPMGIIATPPMVVSGQTQGVILVGLGVINWMTRRTTGQALRAVLAGNLVVQAGSWLVIVRAVALHIIPGQNAGAVVVHTLLGSGFLYFLLRSNRTAAATDGRTSPNSR